MIIVISRNIDKVSGFPDIILGNICYIGIKKSEFLART